jgi:hypothetical protein
VPSRDEVDVLGLTTTCKGKETVPVTGPSVPLGSLRCGYVRLGQEMITSSNQLAETAEHAESALLASRNTVCGSLVAGQGA